MLFLKIISRIFLFIEILLSVILLLGWTLLYPLLRLRYQETLQYKHLPTIILFRWFLWASNVFDFDCFKK